MSSAVETALAVGVVVFVAHPLVVLLHELAHAAVPLAVSDADVTVRLGTGDGVTVEAGRLTVRASAAGFSLTGGLPGWFSYRGASLSRRESVAASLAGPAMSLALLAAVVFVWPAIAGPARLAATVLAYLVGSQALFTLVPMEYPSWWGAYAGQPSDGRRALDGLRE